MSGADERLSYLCQYRDSYTGKVGYSEVSIVVLLCVTISYCDSLQPGSLIVTENSVNSLSQPDTVSGVYRVKEGGAVDLPCIARGSPLPEYTWYKDGRVVATAPSSPKSHRVILPTGSLFFLNVRQNKKEQV